MSITSLSNQCPYNEIDKASNKIIPYIKQHLLVKYPNRRPKRIFHPKTVGLVEAILTVRTDLPLFLREGLFSGRKTEYKALIRFSTSSATVGPDNTKGFRGMAIKILDVESNDFLDPDPEGKTQDIIMFSSRNFVPGTGELAFDGVKITLGNLLTQAASFLHVASISTTGIIPFLKKVGTSPNVLEEKYYSGTPYAFGKSRAIKWHARPLKTITTVMPQAPAENYLRDQLLEDLWIDYKENIGFELFVQFQENLKSEPIDNSAVIWKTCFYKVGTITILKQNFDTKEMQERAEMMSFSPGHAMIEHAPLGSVNEVRRKVYQKLGMERMNYGNPAYQFPTPPECCK
jgi:catalase